METLREPAISILARYPRARKTRERRPDRWRPITFYGQFGARLFSEASAITLGPRPTFVHEAR